MAGAWHLAQRFLGSLRRHAPSRVDLAWVRGLLSESQWSLWRSMSYPDQRHAVSVARAVNDAFDPASDDVIVAALFHDVGKVCSGLGTWQRVAATLWWAVLDDRYATAWQHQHGWRRRLSDYRRHPQLGEALLRGVDAPDIAICWAGDHHRPSCAWRVPLDIGHVLKDCDDD